MTEDQLTQLKRMTHAEIGLKYMKERVAGKISDAQYRWLIAQGREEPQNASESTEELKTDEMTKDDIEELKTQFGFFKQYPVLFTGDSQNARLYKLLQDGEWHQTPEIQAEIYGADHLGSAAIPSRISDINKKLQGLPFKIESESVNGSVWKYKISDI